MNSDVADLMEKMGGSFVKALANAWYKADHINKKKLEDNFSYFEEYSERLKRNNEVL